MPMQTFSWHHLNEWHVSALPIALMALAAVLYFLGARRTTWSRWRSAWFYSALVVTFLATESVLGVFDMSYFPDHMIQHLLLIMVAAPLLALARPLDLLYVTGPDWAQRALDSRVATALTHPIAGLLFYFVFIPVAHLTGVFQLMMEHEWVHHLEQVGFLVVGYLFFRVAFGAERGRTLHPGLRVVFVMAAVPVDTFTGLALVMSTHLPFAGYLGMLPMGTTTESALNLFHLGGAIMWIGGDALMLLACIPMVVQWVRWETRKTVEIDAELDRLGL